MWVTVWLILRITQWRILYFDSKCQFRQAGKSVKNKEEKLDSAMGLSLPKRAEEAEENSEKVTVKILPLQFIIV